MTVQTIFNRIAYCNSIWPYIHLLKKSISMTKINHAPGELYTCKPLRPRSRISGISGLYTIIVFLIPVPSTSKISQQSFTSHILTISFLEVLSGDCHATRLSFDIKCHQIVICQSCDILDVVLGADIIWNAIEQGFFSPLKRR